MPESASIRGLNDGAQSSGAYINDGYSCPCCQQADSLCLSTPPADIPISLSPPPMLPHHYHRQSLPNHSTVSTNVPALPQNPPFTVAAEYTDSLSAYGPASMETNAHSRGQVLNDTSNQKIADGTPSSLRFGEAVPFPPHPAISYHSYSYNPTSFSPPPVSTFPPQTDPYFQSQWNSCNMVWPSRPQFQN
jgi:hypothetical protein